MLQWWPARRKKAVFCALVTWRKPLMASVELMRELSPFGDAAAAQEGCPLRDVLDRVGDKWSVLVVICLSEGTQRFSALRRRIEGISQRMLTETLRQLERDGIVRRTAYAVVQPSV
jgi:DNA-binding HxlR family transcriptional regulator